MSNVKIKRPSSPNLFSQREKRDRKLKIRRLIAFPFPSPPERGIKGEGSLFVS